MKKALPADMGASVRTRLLRLARERGEDFQLVLTRYANERLLFRLATSRHGSLFVLKGAALFTLWTGKPHRATRDLDLLGFGDPGEGHIREVFTEVLALGVEDDGVRLDPSVLEQPDRRLDDGIVAARWLTPEEIQASADRHRSPLIVRCVEDFMAGRRYPLDLLTHYG